MDKPLSEPEPVFGRARPMTSHFASLTPEQQRRALSYDGDEQHGDPDFPKEKRRGGRGTIAPTQDWW